MPHDDVTVVFGGRLPSGDANGLAGMGSKLAADDAARKQIRAAIVLFDVAEVSEKTDDGSRKAKLRVRRIEAIQGRRDFDVLQEMLMHAFEERTGQTTLPFELAADVEQMMQRSQEPWAGKRTWPAGDVEGRAPDDVPL